jgi:hypothetical protein
MPRFAFDYTLKGRIEIDARDLESAHEKFNDKDASDLADEVEDIEITDTEKVEDYRDDEDE